MTDHFSAKKSVQSLIKITEEPSQESQFTGLSRNNKVFIFGKDSARKLGISTPLAPGTPSSIKLGQTFSPNNLTTKHATPQNSNPIKIKFELEMMKVIGNSEIEATRK